MRNTDEFAVIDFEMPDRYGRSICAAGICTYKDGKACDSYYSLIDPQCGFDPEISVLTGITAESVIGAPTFDKAWEEMRPLTEGKIIVAHGAPNDLAALSHCLKKYKLPRPETVRFACTLTLAQAVLPEGTKFGLDRLSEEFGVALPHHHNALSDAHACAELFLILREKCEEPEKYESSFNMLTYHAQNAKDRKRAEQAAKFTEALKELHSDEYALEQQKTMPCIRHEKLLGVPVKEIKKLSSRLTHDIRKTSFMHTLPHTYYEENMLHAFLINKTKNVNTCIAELELFLPNVDDINILMLLCPSSFKNHPAECLPWLLASLRSKKPNIAVFACEYLRKLFLGKNYSKELAEHVLHMRGQSDKKIKDAQARFFSELFLRDKEETERILSDGRLDEETVRETVKRISAKKSVPDSTKHELRQKYLCKEKNGESA